MIADPPRKMVIETTQACVLHCRYCPTGLGLIHRPDLMPWELFTKIADEIQNYVRHVYIEFMGEPALHPRLGSMIDRIKEFATIDIATNGVLVSPRIARAMAYCDVISVTICGLGDTYREVHGVDAYEKAIRGLYNLLDAADNVRWTWLVIRQNEHQMEEAQQLAEELGAIWHPKGTGLGIYSRKDMAPIGHEYCRYDENFGLRYDRANCPEFWETGYVCSDGTAVLCGFDWGAFQPMGNIQENAFLEIWNGPAYRKAREEHLAGKLQPVCRLCCGNSHRQCRDNEWLGEAWLDRRDLDGQLFRPRDTGL